uniref:UPF0695 membrane protein C977.11/PB8B6.06c n=1 Tax=Phallusia mammillata TaxID=59560 RepID=A0A6F9D9C4_9ASCI|nr:UPF0695 membrane protein C977.11/PB8B6.06c [Phallusia mammillata]
MEVDGSSSERDPEYDSVADGKRSGTPSVVGKKNGNGVPDVATQPTPSQPSEVWFYIQIAFFAMCGCLCRIGIDRCFGNLAKIENSAQIVNQSFFSNIFGSFVLGALNGSPMSKTRLAALLKGLTTGFCGSFTTWSKWNQQISLTLVGESQTPGTQMQVLSIASWFIGFYTFIGSYAVGIDFGKDVGRLIGKHVHKKGDKIANVCVTVLLLLATGGFIAGVVVDPTVNKQIWLAVLFAPFGACLRAWLSRFRIERFKLPLGTLIANVLGAVLLAGLHVINTRAVHCTGSGISICWPTIVTYGVGTGFCACLTTISTFMSEVYKLRPEHPRFAYFYALLTVITCQVLTGIINGINLNYDTY